MNYNAILIFLLCTFSAGALHAQQWQWGLIDTKGNVVLPAVYEELGTAGHGYVPAKQAGKWGYVRIADKSWAVQPIYQHADAFEQAYVRLFTTDGNILFMDSTLTILNTLPSKGYWYVAGGIPVWQEDDNVMSIRNWRGDVLVRDSASASMGFRDGYLLVRKNKASGYYNGDGKLVVKYGYDDASEFREGFATVRKGDSLFILDRQLRRKYVTNGSYVGAFYDGMAVFKRNGLWGAFDTRGTVRIEPKFAQGFFFNSGRARVSDGNGKTYIDRNGRPVSLPNTAVAQEFQSGLSRFIDPATDGSGYMDTAGNVVIHPSHQLDRNFSNGYAAFHTHNGVADRIVATTDSDQPNTVSGTASSTTLKPYSSSSSVSRDIFNTKGSMVIYSGSNMLVWKITGSKAVDAKLVAARCADSRGIRGDYKYQHFAGYSCDNLKNTYSRQFSVSCQGEVSTD